VAPGAAAGDDPAPRPSENTKSFWGDRMGSSVGTCPRFSRVGRGAGGAGISGFLGPKMGKRAGTKNHVHDPGNSG